MTTPDVEYRLQFMKDGPPKMTNEFNGTTKVITDTTADKLRDLLNAGVKGNTYGVTGGFETGQADGYHIMNTHPEINAFRAIFKNSKSNGGRRRPSRKYKKSKRVMRRKSRSTRRR